MNRRIEQLAMTIPVTRTGAVYTDPVFTDEERWQTAAQVVKQKQALRRAKLGERCVVFTVAGLIVITMLPVLVLITLIALVLTAWRRAARLRARRSVASRIDAPDSLDDRDRRVLHYRRRRRLRRQYRHGVRRRRRMHRPSILRYGLRTFS